MIDLRGLFSGQSVTLGNLATYVTLTPSGGDIIVSVDADGAGAGGSVQLLTLDNLAGVTAADLYNQGNLFVS